MISTIIIDDENPARLRIKKLMEAHADQLNLLDEADCGSDAVQLIDSLKPDAIFLDIQMPDMSGFDVLQKITHQPLVIFTTAYSEHAIRAFETYSVDYLVKPIGAERFNKAIEKLTHFIKKEENTEFKKLEKLFQQINPVKKTFSLPVKKKDKIILIDFEDIAYFKADDKYVLAMMQDGNSHLLNKTITQLEQGLPDEFIRIHRSCIVNRSFIMEIKKYFKGKLILVLKDKKRSEVMTGETYSGKVKGLLGI